MRQTSGPRWAGFPKLSETLGGRQLPWSYYGFTSATGSFFDSYRDLLELTLLIREFGLEIEQQANLVELKKLSNELEKLQCQLQAASRGFEEYSGQIHELWTTVRAKMEQLSARDE